jgi:hypothetical protein
LATAAALLALTALSVTAGLAFLGRLPLGFPQRAGTGAVFYVVPYHYGFAFYDRDLNEIETVSVKAGEAVTLHIVPAHALPEAVFHQYVERSMKRAIGGLPAADPAIRRKLQEDLDLGNVEHIVGIAAHPVYLATDVASVLRGRPFRENGPTTLREAVSQGDPSIKSVTFTAKKVGAFDVICVDSGMDGAGTCGWGHAAMVAKGAFVVRP